MSRISPGIRGSLNAPGLVTPPPVVQDNTGQQLLQVLGQLGPTTDRVVGALHRERQKRESEQAEIERADAEFRGFEQGQAKGDARQDMQDILLSIEQGREDVDENLSVAENAQNILAKRVPANASQTYFDSYLDALAPQVTSKLAGARLHAIEEAKGRATQQRADAIAGTTDPDEFSDALDDLVNTVGLDEEDARSKLGLYAASYAAQAGDAEAFQSASEFLGGRNEVEVQRLRNQLATNMREQFVARRQTAEDEIAGMLLDMSDPSSSTTLNQVTDRVSTLSQQMNLGDEWALQQTLRARSLAERNKDALLAERVQFMQQSATEEHFEHGMQWLDDAVVTNGYSTLPESTTLRIPADESPTGEEITWKVSRDDIAQAYVSREFQRIAADDAIEDKLAEQVRVVSGMRGYIHDPWVSSLQGAMLGTTDAELDPEDITPDSGIAQAYNLASRLMTLNRSYAQSILPDDVYGFWETARSVQEMTGKGTPQILASMGRARQQGRPMAATVNSARKVAADIDEDSADLITPILQKMATGYMVTSRGEISEEAALKMARRDYRSGWGSISGAPYRKADAPANIQRTRNLLREFAWEFGVPDDVKQEIGKGDITVRYDNGQWLLWNEKWGEEIFDPEGNVPVVYSPDALRRIDAEMENQRQRREMQKAMQQRRTTTLRHRANFRAIADITGGHTDVLESSLKSRQTRPSEPMDEDAIRLLTRVGNYATDQEVVSKYGSGFAKLLNWVVDREEGTFEPTRVYDDSQTTPYSAPAIY